tara:strand:+ start:1816 stop:2454 length:639 start_codon:yes stop_codon:yes gene_type:complete
MDISQIRKDYTKGGLDCDDLNDSPFEQFGLWLEQAIKAEIKEPTAMSLATVGKDGQPSLRTVLLKHFDEAGFNFYTNQKSAKAIQISENDHVALLFPWLDLERQVIIRGRAEKTSVADSMRYFASRPTGSQLSAWASPQSTFVESRKFLEMQLAKIKEKFKSGDIPLPDFWGGYRIVPATIEFWQGGKDRLHDRFLYTRESAGSWLIQRKAP